MYHRFLLHFIQRFSYLQQYLIISSISLILLFIFRYWWCIFLLPISTILVNITIKRLSRSNQSPLKCSGHLYNFLFRKRSNDSKEKPTNAYAEFLEKECDTYVRTILARYICVWYYPLISTDKDFLDALRITLNGVINRLNDRLSSLDIYDIIRQLIDLKQKHIEQYLYSLDSFRKQYKQNRISKSVDQEFSQIIGYHNSIANNDIHAYFKALVELLLTELLPETIHIYSTSRPGREFLTQILVNCIFLPLFNQFSKPRMIYYLLVILLESDEETKAYEANENSLIIQPEMIDAQNERESVALTDDLSRQSSQNDEHPVSRLERIIYSATIILVDTAYNPMSGAAYTVYIIQCETKSPFTSDATHRYTIRRRFREFLNLHKRLQQNRTTSQHCCDIDEVYRRLPLGMDNMNPDIIRRRRNILEKYIQKLISNEVLNCSHNVLEFFAFNSDPNIEFESSPSSKLPVPRVDKVLLRTLSDVGTKLNSFLPAKREITPLRETFQLNISTIYENRSPYMEQLKYFNERFSRSQQTIHPSKLSTNDSEFLQSLLTRPSIVTSSRRKEKTHLDIPLTDAVLNLVYTSLHSRDAIISNESIHQILRTIFGHFIEKFLKNEINDILSHEKILTYLSDLRTKVLWPDDQNTSIPMKNVKHRAYNAIITKLPLWLRHMIGVDNIHRIVVNLLECLSYEQLNRHLLCNAFDLLIEHLIPNIATQDFLTKYAHMHTGIRS